MRAVLVAVLAVVLAAGAAAARSDATPARAQSIAKSAAPVLGISPRAPRGALAWFDPITLRALPGRKAPLAGHTHGWAFSQSRAVVALSRCLGEGHPRESGIRFVDARSMRVLGDVRLSRRDGCVGSLAWLRPGRLLAVVHTDGAAQLVVVDPLRRRVVRREPLLSPPWDVGRTRDELVLLLATHDAIAPVRVAVVDAEGTVRTTVVPDVLAGTRVDEQSADHHARTVRPGLAVDPDARRAFLVPAAGTVAELDLRTSELSYRRLDAPSPLRRLLGWLFPDADAKVVEGPVREARWLGEGTIAVSGTDYSLTRNARGEALVAAAPVGLTLIDASSWSSRQLDAAASGFSAGAGVVVAQGGRWDSGAESGTGPGLRAFDLDGRERWQLFPGRYRWMDAAGPFGYAYDGDDSTVDVVDLATGSVLGRVRWSERAPLPQLLAEQASRW